MRVRASPRSCSPSCGWRWAARSAAGSPAGGPSTLAPLSNERSAATRSGDGKPGSPRVFIVSSAGVLVVDVGTSGVRAAVVRSNASVEHVHYREVLPSTPAPGFVEFDAGEMA